MDEHNTIESPSVSQAGSRKQSKILLKISRILLFVAVFGGLVGFIPSAFISGVFLKAGLIYTGIISAFVLTVLATLRSNEILLPNNMFQYVLPAVPVAYLLAALMSPSWGISFTGYGFEIGTVGFIAAMTLLVYLTTMLLRKKKYVSLFQFLVLTSGFVLFLIQLAVIFTPNLFNLSSVLATPISNFVGNINDLAVFFAAVLVLALTIVEFQKTTQKKKVISYIAIAMSLFILAIANFTNLWILTGLFALVVFIIRYTFSGKLPPDESNAKLSMSSLILVIISAVFILFGTSLSTQLYRAFEISGSDLYPPTISQTLPVVSEAFKENPIFGVGPNRFSTEWIQNKPDQINRSLLWSIDYNYGNSIFLTSIVTVGLVGIIAWLASFAVLVFTGIKYVFGKKNGGMLAYIPLSSFMLTTFLWLALVIHVPSSGLLALTFMSTGMFIVSLYVSGLLKTKTFKLDSKPNISFAVVLTMVLLLIGGVAFDYLALSKVYASYSYQKGVAALNVGNFEEAKDYMRKAISFGGDDIYYRGLSNVYVNELRVRAPELTSNPTDNEIQITSSLFDQARIAARLAIEEDETNYQNYISLGNVLQIVISPDPSTDTAYTTAKGSFEKALELNPKNPSIYLALANLEIVRNNQEGAVDYIAQALELKPNYTQARFVWAQMQVAAGNIDGAVELLEDASSLSPRDAGIQFQLGLLRFENRDYRGAAGSFDRVLQLIPDHANAAYYLALSYSELDRVEEALSILERIKLSNPSNPLLDATIENLSQPNPEPIETPDLDELDELPIEEDIPVEEEI